MPCMQHLFELNDLQRDALEKQDMRLVEPFRVEKFQREAKKHWDLFYKRNEGRFFKDRHWTTREFVDLITTKRIPESGSTSHNSRDARKKILVEFGCGAGNFAFPLVEDEECEDLFIFACDFSPRAVQLIKENPLYDESRIVAFQLDITERPDTAFEGIPLTRETADLASLMFVLSAIPPDSFGKALSNVQNAMKPGGVLLFRDYAMNDMAMFRFGSGTKINSRNYLRQDGTMTYFFEMQELRTLVETSGFAVRSLECVERRTVNKKEEIDVPRLFVQGTFTKK